MKPELTLDPSQVRTVRPRPPAPNFDDRPDGSLIRACDLVRDPRYPNRVSVLDISLSTLWRYVNAGTFPRPLSLSGGARAWRVGDVRAWIEQRHADVMAMSA